MLSDGHVQLAPRIFLGERLQPKDCEALPHFAFVEPPASRSRSAGTAVGLALPSLLASLSPDGVSTSWR